MKLLLATTKIEDFDRFTKVFAGSGADKRKHHGSRRAQIFRDPGEAIGCG